MKNLSISKSILQAALLSAFVLTPLVFTVGCSSSNNAEVTPLGSADLNHNWTLYSAPTPNPPAIFSLVGNMTSGDAPTKYDPSYNLPATASLTITPTSGNSACSAQTIPMTGSLNNPAAGYVYLNLSGNVGEGGTIVVSGQYYFDKQKIYGNYTITGGPCNMTSTSFVGTLTGTTP